MPVNSLTRRLVVGLALAAGAMIAPPAFASEEGGTADEAKAMAERAAQLVRTTSIDSAMAEFEKRPGPFWDRDLYVFVFKSDGTALFNAATPTLRGKNLLDLKDASGFGMVRAFLALKEPGWVEYQWSDPITKRVRVKQSYVVPLGDMVVGVGLYKRA